MQKHVAGVAAAAPGAADAPQSNTEATQGAGKDLLLFHDGCTWLRITSCMVFHVYFCFYLQFKRGLTETFGLSVTFQNEKAL